MRLEERFCGWGGFQLVLNSCGSVRAQNWNIPTTYSEMLLQRTWTDIYLLYQSVFVLFFSVVAHTSVLSLSLRTPRSTPVKLSSAAMVSILMNWFSRMAEPTALSDS